jgi:hypothetical protein
VPLTSIWPTIPVTSVARANTGIANVAAIINRLIPDFIFEPPYESLDTGELIPNCTLPIAAVNLAH